jgi:hypothetical protein
LIPSTRLPLHRSPCLKLYYPVGPDLLLSGFVDRISPVLRRHGYLESKQGLVEHTVSIPFIQSGCSTELVGGSLLSEDLLTLKPFISGATCIPLAN